MATAIAMVLVTVLALAVVWEVRRVLVWIVVAAFLAVALDPVVTWVQRRVTHRHRALATLLVFLVAALVLAGLVALFTVPLAREATKFAQQVPALLDDVRAGRGPIGDFLDKTNALQLVREHQDQIQSSARGLTTPAVGVLSGVATGVVGLVTIVVLAYLMVLERPKVVEGVLNLMTPPTRDRVRRVGADCAKSITGYLSGNLAISVICGILHYIVLKAVGVPFAGLIALFVAITDLIPLVGATIGAVVALIAAAVTSVPALIAVAILVVVYQQLENHLLQPLILARTVRLNPLTVLVSILVFVELAGVLGALLAIPIAGMLQVIARDVWDHRRGAPKSEPTVGETGTSISRGAAPSAPRPPRPGDLPRH